MRLDPQISLIIGICIFSICIGSNTAQDYDTYQDTALTPGANDRTLISDIIGFSALKLMLILSVPLVFAIFLGAMLVLLFPFPLVTSTAGLAGAAAVGRRQGRVASDADELNDLLQYLGLSSSNPNANSITDPLTLKSGHQSYARVKKQFRSLQKVKQFNNYNGYKPIPNTNGDGKTPKTVKNGGTLSIPNGERCSEWIACEIGRSADQKIRVFINQVIEELPLKSQQKFKSTIQAYLEGMQSTVLISESPQPPIGPVYTHNVCPKYKCKL